MSSFEKYGLTTNPFRVTPATNPNELIWAGFKETRDKIEKRISRSISIPPSTLVLNWGEYGSGKTHAARFFNKEEVLRGLAETNKTPISFYISFPKSKEPVKDIYTQLIDKLDINNIRGLAHNGYLQVSDDVLNDITDNAFIRNLIKLFFDDFVSDKILKTYLYGNYKISETLINAGVSRKLSTDNDYIEFLGALFSFITYQKSACSCIIIWIDEFEDISLQTGTNISNVNNFIRSLLDFTPNNLLLFLNLTQTATMDREDLGEYLLGALKSRIKAHIELSIPDDAALKEYLEELLNNPVYRINNCGKSGYDPFTVELINSIINDERGASLRRYNEIFSLLLEYALSDKKEIIDLDYFKSIKDEIINC
jgi:hypothetical protein